jgi:hypothetical protein
MKLIDLIKSMANQVYFIGLTTDIEYADGIMMTPFDFMRHDIIHSSRVLQDLDYFRPDLSYVKEFIEHIDNNNKYNQKKLQTALFLLMHETFGGYHYLSRPIINFFNKGKKLSFLKEILFQDISNISKWRDTTYFGLILPKNIRENKEDTVIVEYINSCFEYLQTVWNNYFNTEEELHEIFNTDPENNRINMAYRFYDEPINPILYPKLHKKENVNDQNNPTNMNNPMGGRRNRKTHRRRTFRRSQGLRSTHARRRASKRQK